MKQTLIALWVGVALTAISLPSAGHGEVLVQQPLNAPWDGAGDSYDGDLFYDDFTISSDSSISQLTWWGAGVGYDQKPSEKFRVVIYGASDLPLEGEAGLQFPVLDTSRPKFDEIVEVSYQPLFYDISYANNKYPHGAYEYSISLSSPLTLGVGNYYIGIGAADDGAFLWSASTNKIVGPLDRVCGMACGYKLYPDRPEAEQILLTGANLAFAIGGMAAAVPEPSSWAMLIVGFGLVGGMMRRRPFILHRSPLIQGPE